MHEITEMTYEYNVNRIEIKSKKLKKCVLKNILKDAELPSRSFQCRGTLMEKAPTAIIVSLDCGATKGGRGAQAVSVLIGG